MTIEIIKEYCPHQLHTVLFITVALKLYPHRRNYWTYSVNSDTDHLPPPTAKVKTE
jgi:hypothetical protein